MPNHPVSYCAERRQVLMDQYMPEQLGRAIAIGGLSYRQRLTQTGVGQTEIVVRVVHRQLMP